MPNIVNTAFEKNTSYAIMVYPTSDYEGWTFYYSAKVDKDDTDAEAAITITPTWEIDNEDVHYILIEFEPSKTKNIHAKTYHHSLKVVSSDELTAYSLFNGKLTITHNDVNDEP